MGAAALPYSDAKGMAGCTAAESDSALLSDDKVSAATAAAEGWKTWAGCGPALRAPKGLGGTRGTAAVAGLDLQPDFRNATDKFL